MTSFTVRHVRRPIDEAMFADLGVETVAFQPTTDGGQQITTSIALTLDQIVRARCRLTSPDTATEALLWSAYQAWQANGDYLTIPAPTSAQAIAQVHALTAQIRGIMQYLLPELQA